MRRLVVVSVGVALLFALVVLPFGFDPARAQENLLTNGGLEQNDDEYGPYIGKGRGDLTVPEGWDIWLGQGDTGQFFNRGDKVYAFPHNGFDPNAVEGTWAFNLNGGYVQFNAALLQTVDVSPGTNLIAEAKVYVQACDFDGADKCANDPEKNARVRIGIDPDGGRDPNASEIVWSGWQDPWDTWKDTKVEATASGGTITVFIFTTQSTVAERNVAYFDDVRLFAGGGGGSNSEDAEPEATPVPTFPPFVDFVSPQGARDDGSIVHVVGEGDTLDSIAVAYGTNREEIAQLNPNLASLRFLRIGQEIVIREAQPTETPEPASTPIPGGVATEEPDSEADDEETTSTEEVAELPSSDEDDDAQPAEEVAELPEADDEAAEDDAAEETSGGGGLITSVTGALQRSAAESDTSSAQAVAMADDADAEMDDMDMDDMDMDEDTSEDAMDDATPEAEADEADPTATPRPAVDITASTASVCVLLFEDINQNRLREANEELLAGGTVTVNRGDSGVGTYQTDGENEPYCFSDLEAGDYTAVMQAPAGYGLTSPEQLRLPLTSGTSLNIEFGAAQGLEVAVAPPADGAEELSNSADEVLPADAATSPTDNIVLIAGVAVAALAGVMVVAGVGATVLLRRAR